MQTDDDIRTDLAFIRTGLACWGMALLLLQQPVSWPWIVFAVLGLGSMWRARRSVI